MGIYQSKQISKVENDILYIVVKEKDNLQIIQLKKYTKPNQNSSDKIAYFKFNKENFSLLQNSEFDMFYLNKSANIEQKFIFFKNFCNDSIKITKNKIFDVDYIDHTIESDSISLVIRFNQGYKGIENFVILKD